MAVHRAAVLVGLALLFASCDDTAMRIGAGFAAPSAFGDPARIVGAGVQPTPIPFQRAPSFHCPLFAPFAASFTLLIDRHAGPDIFLDRVAFRFVDRSGLPSLLDLPRGDLTARFGTTLVPGGSSRAFDFHPRFGCGFVSPPSRLFIDLVFVERSGTTHARTLRVELR